MIIPPTVSLEDFPCFSAGFQIKFLTSVQALPLHECSGKIGNIAASDVWCLACACQCRNEIRNRISRVSSIECARHSAWCRLPLLFLANVMNACDCIKICAHSLCLCRPGYLPHSAESLASHVPRAGRRLTIAMYAMMMRHAEPLALLTK